MLVAALERVGVYYYFTPTYAQGRKFIWDNIDDDGFKMLDHIPKQLVRAVNNSSMKIELTNGSIIQIIGTDNLEGVRGTNPVGCVFSEFAFMKPSVWGVISPILLKNGGWCIVITTPNGPNKAFELYNAACQDPSWWVEKVDIEHSFKKDGSPVYPLEAVQNELRFGRITQDEMQREYYLDFAAAVEGAYYTKELQRANEEKRISKVPFDPDLMVYTAWDLGINDTTAIWFAQVLGKEIRVIDYYENFDVRIDHYLQYIADKTVQGWKFATHFLPHDSRKRSLDSGKSVEDRFIEFGIKNYTVLKRVDDQRMKIDSARRVFGNMWFDQEKCREGLEALQNYHRKYNEETESYSDRPLHDWSSNGADSFAYLAQGLEDLRPTLKKKKLPSTQHIDYATMSDLSGLGQPIPINHDDMFLDSVPFRLQ